MSDGYNPYSRIVSRTVLRVLRLIGENPGTARTRVNLRNDSNGRWTVDTLVSDGYIEAIPFEDHKGHSLTLSPKGVMLLSLMEQVVALTADDSHRFNNTHTVGGGQLD